MRVRVTYALPIDHYLFSHQVGDGLVQTGGNWNGELGVLHTGENVFDSLLHPYCAFVRRVEVIKLSIKHNVRQAFYVYFSTAVCSVSVPSVSVAAVCSE
jgi:hypothetical protein